MIVALDGLVKRKDPTFVFLKLSCGITYRIHISLFTSTKIDINTNISLDIVEIYREDAHLLFGFLDPDEKRLFETLIKISGVGPSTAMAICSTLTPSAFSSAIAQNDSNMLRRVPGIGPKGAKRILVELSDFTLQSNFVGTSMAKEEARMALESLGFKKDSVASVLSTCNALNTTELIKEALQKLGK